MKSILDCPLCGENGCVETVTEKHTHIVKNNVYEGDFIFYRCSDCGGGFTTDESDEFSLKNLKQKKK